nr:DNA-directed DNA polymerase [Tanacetum cinerariifolium]
MEELCQPTLNGRGRPIVPIAIQAMNFGLKNDMIQQIQNSCQFHGLSGDDANKHLDKFLHVTQSIKVNRVTDDALCLYLCPHSLTHHATAWFDRFLRNSITTFEQMAKMFLEKYFPPFMVTKLRNKITNFHQRPDESLFEAWERYKLLIDRCPNYNMLPVTQIDTFYNGLTLRHRDTINAAAGGTFMKRQYVWSIHENEYRFILGFGNNTITNPKEDLKGITTQSGNSYKEPTIPTTSSSSKVVERETEVTKDTMPFTNNRSTKDVQPLVVQVETQIPNSKPVVAPVVEPVKAPSLLTNKEKLFELARTPLNEHCSTVLLKKLLEKLGDPDKFLILCDFPRMDECLALADLGANINLMPLYVWKMLSLPELSPTCMTLELAEYSQEVLGFFVSGNPTPSMEPIVSISSPTLTPFGDSDFLLEETDAFLAIEDEPISPEINDSFYDSEGDILLLKEFLNDDPSSPPLPPQELKVVEPKNKKSSIDEPSVVELKDLPLHLEYAFLEGDDKLPVIIAKDLKYKEKTTLIKVLKSHKQALAWKLSDVKGINLEFCTHKILKEDDFKLTVQHQRGSLGEPRALCSKKGGFSVVENEENKLIPTRLVTGWHVCFDYQKLNDATRKDHFPLLFMDQMLERLAGNEYYCFLDGFTGCMMAIFHDMIEKTLEVFMDDFSIFGNSFETYLSYLDKMLKRCEDTNLCLNWEKSHFIVKEGIILGHKISKNGIEVDKAKVDVISKLPHPTTVKGIRSFLGHVGFYRRFI